MMQHAIRQSPNRIRLQLAALGCAVLLFGPGCATTPAPISPARMGTLAELAAYTGSALYLAKHPEHRAIFATVRNSLDVLLENKEFDPLKFYQALQPLPIKELKSDEASVIVAAVVILWDAYAKETITLDRSIYIAPVIEGVSQGLTAALNQVTQ